MVSVNLSGLEKNPGFSLTLPFIRKAVFAMMYGDIIVNVANQVRPYEVEQGKADAMIAHWSQKLVDGFQSGKGMSRGQMRALFDQICADFASIPVQGEPKIRVGVVGEIYVKFAPLGNNNLEQFLLSEGVEPVVPGLTDFIIFKIYNRVADVDLYGGKWIKKAACRAFMSYIEGCQKDMIAALKKSGRFRAPGTFQELHSLVHGYLGDGNKMGEVGSYANFNMNDELAAVSHDWDRDFFPAATSLEYHYAYQNRVSVKDIYQIPAMIRQAMEEKQGGLFLSLIHI